MFVYASETVYQNLIYLVFQKSFIESLLDLYEQETEEMIDVIEESRMELRGDFLHISEETKSLRAESRMLGVYSQGFCLRQ